MQSLLQRTTAFLTPSTSSTSLAKSAQSSSTSNHSSPASPSNKYIFPTVSRSDDPSCLLDCSTCTTHYPSKWSIDESDPLYGHIKGWGTHLLIATGKADWVRDVADEKGSVMEAVGKHGLELANGRCMVSACNMPVPDYEDEDGGGDGLDGREKGETEVLVLPKWEIVEDVKPARVRQFMEGYVARVASTMTPVPANPSPSMRTQAEEDKMPNSTSQQPVPPPPSPPLPSSDPSPRQMPPHPPFSSFATRPCPHRALILLCSQKTRDARCGQSAPLLRREFERHLRPLGLYRDMRDERPGGVGIYFISHVGGHKYAANVMIYRRGGSQSAMAEGEGGKGAVWEEEREGELTLVRSRTRTRSRSQAQAQTPTPTLTQSQNGTQMMEENQGEAAQCIWLARVRPEDCEAIIKYTVLQGKVVKPERQLRGGFDRGKGLTSW